MKNLILAYNEAAENLADTFAEKYYGKDASEIFWIGNEVGGVLCINDDFWNFRDIVTALELKIPKKKLFEWNRGETIYNLKTFAKTKHCGSSSQVVK